MGGSLELRWRVGDFGDGSLLAASRRMIEPDEIVFGLSRPQVDYLHYPDPETPGDTLVRPLGREVFLAPFDRGFRFYSPPFARERGALPAEEALRMIGAAPRRPRC